ncbi:MAG: hypothetical protein JXX28_05775 [Deltaproteobacteria bacterium]|nr:hypothetical protein [Deltaproteobacteria bacterium]
MRLLREGERAPAWSLPDATGTPRADQPGWRLWVFAPNTAGAEDYLAALSERAAAFGREGACVALFSPVPLQVPGATVLVDRSLGQFRAAGALRERPTGGPLGLWGLLLVNPEGRVRMSEEGRPSIDAALRTLQALRATVRT